jgi:hypothetical protein
MNETKISKFQLTSSVYRQLNINSVSQAILSISALKISFCPQWHAICIFVNEIIKHVSRSGGRRLIDSSHKKFHLDRDAFVCMNWASLHTIAFVALQALASVGLVLLSSGRSILIKTSIAHLVCAHGRVVEAAFHPREGT